MNKSITIVLKPIGRTSTKQSSKSTGHIIHNNIYRQRLDFADEEIPTLKNGEMQA